MHHHRPPRGRPHRSPHLTSWEITNVIHEAAHRDLFNLEATLAAIERGNGRSTKAAKKAVQLHLDGSAGARSKNELKVLIDLERRKLPEPKFNTHLNGYEVDYHWPALKLAIELDGSGHDRTRTKQEDALKERAWRPRATSSFASETPSRFTGRCRARAPRVIGCRA